MLESCARERIRLPGFGLRLPSGSDALFRGAERAMRRQSLLAAGRGLGMGAIRSGSVVQVDQMPPNGPFAVWVVAKAHGVNRSCLY